MMIGSEGLVTLARNQHRVLQYLAGQTGEIAGIEIADGLDELGRSSVYAALAALQRDGLVGARWDHSASHPRRLVKLNGAGERALVEERRSQERLVKPRVKSKDGTRRVEGVA
jgi:DNA-binding PadR family transcriptional regulator